VTLLVDLLSDRGIEFLLDRFRQAGTGWRFFQGHCRSEHLGSGSYHCSIDSFHLECLVALAAFSFDCVLSETTIGLVE
jgi:hypothetical protein